MWWSGGGSLIALTHTHKFLFSSWFLDFLSLSILAARYECVCISATLFLDYFSLSYCVTINSNTLFLSYFLTIRSLFFFSF